MENPKVLLFDADGVVILPRKKYFSDRLVDEFGVSKEESDKFVRDLIEPAVVGRMDVMDQFPDLLKKWGIQTPAEEMLKIWWSGENTPNQDVLNVISQFRGKGVKTYLASDQEKYKGIHLLEDQGLKNYFDGVFVSYEMGVKKHDEAFWKKLLEHLKNVDPSQMFYWDDDRKNVELAKRFGINGYFFENYDKFKEQIDQLQV